MRHYQEGYAALELDSGFFRPDSILARDLSVLAAAFQFNNCKKRDPSLQWLDLMAGSGIRSLRWATESIDSNNKEIFVSPVEFWVNDANSAGNHLRSRNLKELIAIGLKVNFENEKAEVFLANSFLQKRFFDFIDIDCFGSPNAFLQPLINVLAFDGLLMLSSTASRSLTGHERKAGVRQFFVSSRAHPSHGEIAIRIQLGVIARHAWLLGKGIEPLVSYSDGRTYRILIRLKKNLSLGEEDQIGFMARCENCGSQLSQKLINFKNWGSCNCRKNLSELIVNGPLWLGKLNNIDFVGDLKNIAKEKSLPITKKTLKFLDRAHLDSGAIPFCWSTDELARRISLNGPPATERIGKKLAAMGFISSTSFLMPKQIRTNAPIGELLRICKEESCEGFK